MGILKIIVKIIRAEREHRRQMIAVERVTRRVFGEPRMVYRNGKRWVVYGSNPWAS